MGQNWFIWCMPRREWAKSTGDIWKFCSSSEDASYFNKFLKSLFRTFKTFRDASKMIDLKRIAPNGTYLVHLVYVTTRMSQKYRWYMKVLQFFRRCSIFQYVFEESVQKFQNFSWCSENDRFKRESAYLRHLLNFGTFGVHNDESVPKVLVIHESVAFFSKVSIFQYVFEESVQNFQNFSGCSENDRFKRESSYLRHLLRFGSSQFHLPITNASIHCIRFLKSQPFVMLRKWQI